MTRIKALLVLVFLAFATPALAQCNPLGSPPQIAVSIFTPHIVYHHDVDIVHLQSLGHSAERPPRGSLRLGVTSTINTPLEVKFKVITIRAGGQFCVYVNELTGSLGDVDMDVYVASNYPQGSCEYNVILAHENTHARFNLQTLIDWIPRIRQSLIDTVAQKFPLIAPARPSNDEVRKVLVDGIKGPTDQMEQDMAARNATIDTPDSYRRTTALCRNW